MFMIGKVSDKARELVQTCQDALNAAIAVCAPGVPLSEIGKTIEAVVKPHGFSISRDFVGHGIGKVMHDDPQIFHFYDKMWDRVKMVPGLVFTIEPMINTGRPECKIDADGWTARTVDGGLSAQWAATTAITAARAARASIAARGPLPPQRPQHPRKEAMRNASA